MPSAAWCLHETLGPLDYRRIGSVRHETVVVITGVGPMTRDAYNGLFANGQTQTNRVERGLYFSSCTVGTPSYGERTFAL